MRNRQWNDPHELGVHLWDAKLRQIAVVMIEAKRDDGDVWRTHIIPGYTVNDVFEVSVAIFCVVNAIATIIEVANDAHGGG